MSALLEVDGLCVPVPGRRWLGGPPPDIVSGVSLSVGEAETLGVVGESGSGKTTIGRAIVGLVKPRAGRIALAGEALPDFSERSYRRLRDRVSMMFQDPISSLSPRLSVGTLVAEPLAIAGARGGRAAAAGLLERVGLPAAFLRRYPHQLSGGQARRVGVARALARLPRLVIADEPTAGLDVSIQGEILNLLADLKAQHGLSLMIITHNLAVVRHVSDRLAITYLGRIVEQGPTRAVFRAPRHPYTRALLESEPVPDPLRRRREPPVTGEVPSLLARPPGCEFHPRCRFAQARCRSEAPAPRAAAAGHLVSCHFPLGPDAIGPAAIGPIDHRETHHA
ncbi:MAG: ABC transporter ATP-binding protein [Dongiaceae bacterium]